MKYIGDKCGLCIGDLVVEKEPVSNNNAQGVVIGFSHGEYMVPHYAQVLFANGKVYNTYTDELRVVSRVTKEIV